MKTFIAAIPLFDNKMTVHAYRLMTRSGEKLFGSADDFRGFGEALKAPGLELVSEIGIEPFAGAVPLFVSLNRFQLLMGIPMNFKLDTEKFICIIDRDVPISGEVFLKLDELKKLGYKLALEGFRDDVPEDIFIDLFDYVILDSTDGDFDELFKKMRLFVFKIKLIFTNVPDMDTFNKLGKVHDALLSGDFYSSPITRGINQISPIKVNALQLMNQINNEDYDLSEAAQTVERDPSLSISLLRFLNSNAMGRQRKIESIRHAVAILGQREFRRWATIAISVGLAEDRPGEITKLSLVRAKFAENLATAYDLGVFQQSLFIAGLFSLLDVILQKPMDQAVNEVAIDARVRRALVDKRGDMYEVLELIYAYERADWDTVSINLIRNKVDVERIIKAFVDALIWYKELLEVIDEETVEEERKE